ncbi:MAG: arylsulfatase [Phocaeicola sp.]
MKRKKTGLLLTLLSSAALTVAQERPHIVLLMTDQQRYDYMGAENPNIITPHLDELCREGNRFVNGYSAAPSSTPARAGLLTGLSPWHHGLLGYSAHISENYKYEMPRMLADAGYHAAAVGKMHWYPQRNLHGLHELYVDESGRVESDGFESDYREWFRKKAPHLNPDSLGIGWNDNTAGVFPLADTLHPTYWTAMKAIEIIDAHNAEKPLFLKVSFARPHSPYDPPQKHLDRYKGVEIEKPWIGEWAAPFDQVDLRPDAPFSNMGADFAVNSRRHYAAAVTFIDEQIGRVIEKLKEEGMYENSLILFVSDHGDMMGDHYHWRKTYPYEGSAKVPFIVKLPKQASRMVGPGEEVKAVAELRDVLPTFLEAAGVEIPQDMDGKSLYKPLKGGDKVAWRNYIDMEHAAAYNSNAWVALTDGNYKYVWNYTSGKEEFFNLQTDPHELKNGIENPAYKESIEIWRNYMVEHLTERGEKWVSKEGKLLVHSSVLKSPYFTP